MGILESQSPLRLTIRQWTGQPESVWVKPTPYGESTESRIIKTTTVKEDAQPQLSFFDRLEIRLSKFDPARANMWVMGTKHAIQEGVWRGSGAGTWARFHRKHRITRLYFEHMHNFYLNLIFEYGIIPMLAIYLLTALILLRLLQGRSGLPRAWLLWFAGVSGIGMGFDLLYFPLTLFGLFLLGVVVLAKSWRTQQTGNIM